MERLIRPALRSVLEAIAGIEAATAGKTIEQYSADWLLRHGVQRGIEIISEAVRRVPLEFNKPNLKFPGPKSPESAMFCATNIIAFRTR